MSVYNSQEFNDGWDDIPPSFQEQILQSVAQLESAALASKSIQQQQLSSPSKDTQCNKKQKRDYMDDGKSFQVYNDQVVSTTDSNSLAAKRKILHDTTNQQQGTHQYIDKDDSIKSKMPTIPITAPSPLPHLDSAPAITTTANHTSDPTQTNDQITKDESDDDSMWLEFDDMDLPALLETIAKNDNNINDNSSGNNNNNSSNDDSEHMNQSNGSGTDNPIMATLAQHDNVLQTYGGFQTAGSGKDIKPSGNSLKAAHEKALALMAEQLSPSPTTTTTENASSPVVISSTSSTSAATSSSPPPPPPTNTPSNTFSNEPSFDAKNTAQQLLLRSPKRPLISSPLDPNAITASTSTTTATIASSGFSTGRGTKLSEPSLEAKRKAQQLLLASPTRSSSTLSLAPLATSTTATTTDTQPSPKVKPPVFDTPSLSSIYNYEDVLQQYGGFSKASGKKSDTVISDAAKQQALLLFSSDMPASQLTQPSIYQHNNSNTSRSSSQSDYNGTIDTHPSFTLVDVSSAIIESSTSSSTLMTMNSFSSSTSTVDLQPPPSDQIVVSQSSPSAIPSAVMNSIPTKSTGAFQRKRRQLQQQQQQQQQSSTTQRLRSKPFKSPAVNLDLVKAGLEKRQTISTVKRMKGPSVFGLHSTGSRQPLSSLGPPMKYTKADLKSMNIPLEILDMTPCKARSYVFETNWGVQEATKELLAAGGLSSMLPLGWVENHYGWIVFKLARHLARFAHHYKDGTHASWWSPAHVLKQLLYRYERDINLGQRSVLKRIMEQDDVPVKQMVLMVADIVSLSSTTTAILPSQQHQQGGPYGTAFGSKGQHRYRLQLTDGWYQISAYVDARMSKMIDQSRIYIGQKLTMTGAQLIGDRTPKTPLEALTMATMKTQDSACDSSTHDSTTTALLISSNSCLPCSWDTKLGYPQQRQRRHVIRRLDDNIYEDGGLITMMDVMICKKYPMMYSETLANGTTVQRNSKDEEDYRRTLEIRQHYAHHHQPSSSHLENRLEDRRVSGYFRLRICDVVNSSNSEPQVQATLMISQATEVIHMDLLEGQCYRLFFVQPYQPKSRHLDGPYLITTRLTKWEPLSPKITTSFAAAASKSASINTSLLKYPLRSICPCIKLRNLTGTDVDIAVLVLHTQPQTSQSSTDGRNVWYTTLLVTDSSSALCQFTYRSYYRPAQNMNGQILGLMNVRFDIYNSKCDIIHIKSSDETEVWSKPTGTMTFMQNAMTDLKRWTESHSSELASLQQRVNNLIQL